MKSRECGGFGIIYEGEGDIPVFIIGPPEVFIPTIPRELKKDCLFFGVNYPFKMGGACAFVPPEHVLESWKHMDDSCRFYHEAAMSFCRSIGKDKYIVAGPSMLGLIADRISIMYAENILGSCILSLAPSTAISESINNNDDDALEPGKSFGSVIKDGVEISDYHFYLDALHEDADKDFNDIEGYRPLWVDLWKKGSDNVKTQTVLIGILAGYELGDSKLNTLLIAGEMDGRSPVSKVKEFRLPHNYKRVILPGGHLTHFEYHREFSDVFLRWLEEGYIKKPEVKIAERTVELRKSNKELKRQILKRESLELELAHFLRISSLTEMVSGISHELAQPLSSIVQYIGSATLWLKKENKTSKALHALNKAEQQAERAGKILQRIKNFLAKKEIKKSPTNLKSLIDEVVGLINRELLENNVELNIDEIDDNVLIYADSIQIQQVILNILMNAIDALKGSLSRKNLLKIQVNPAEDSRVLISISDTGPGISPDKIDHVFDPFYTTKSSGTGMGLSISNTIINAHQGELSVKSILGQGATFRVELPIYSQH